MYVLCEFNSASFSDTKAPVHELSVSSGFAGIIGQFSTMKFHVMTSSFLSPFSVVSAFLGIVSS